MTIYQRTLAQLRSSVQTRWQLDGSPDLGDGTAAGKAALNEMINDALVETHDIFVQLWLDYYTTSSSFATVAGTDSYVLDTIATSTDFYKLRKLEISVGTRWFRLLPHDLDASHHFVSNGSTSKRYRYRIQGGALVLVPTPISVDTLRLYYVTQPVQLVADSDVVTFRVPVAQKLLLSIVGRDVLDRQELDPSPAISRIAALTKQLEIAADGLDASEPFYIDPDGPPPECDEDAYY